MKYKDLNDEGQNAMRNNGTLQFFNELCSKYSSDTLLKELKYQRSTHTAIMPHVKESTIKKWLSALYRDSKHAAQNFFGQLQLPSALHCSMTTVNHCIETLKQHTPDNLRKADTMDVHYFTYEDGRQNPDIIIFNTKFKDDPIPWHFSIYL